MRFITNIYQQIATILDLLSGDLGYALRTRFYRLAGAKIGKNIRIYKHVKICHPQNLEIGNQSSISIGCIISSKRKIKIGQRTAISPYCCIYDHDHVLPEIKKSKFKVNPVVIGNDSWIGAHVVILKGVKIGNNVTIGAGSVVSKDIPDNSIAVGIPAKIVKKNKPISRK
jgi:maltose O-acetyltransferase